MSAQEATPVTPNIDVCSENPYGQRSLESKQTHVGSQFTDAAARRPSTRLAPRLASMLMLMLVRGAGTCSGPADQADRPDLSDRPLDDGPRALPPVRPSHCPCPPLFQHVPPAAPFSPHLRTARPTKTTSVSAGTSFPPRPATLAAGASSPAPAPATPQPPLRDVAPTLCRGRSTLLSACAVPPRRAAAPHDKSMGGTQREGHHGDARRSDDRRGMNARVCGCGRWWQACVRRGLAAIGAGGALRDPDSPAAERRRAGRASR